MTISHYLSLKGKVEYDGDMESRSAAKKAAKKSSLMAAASHLLDSKDIQEIAVSDITTLAGVAKGTFYLFFKDKYELMDALITARASEILTKAQNELEQNDFHDFGDAVIFMVNHILRQLETNPLLMHLIRRNLSMGAFHTQLQLASKEESPFPLTLYFSRLADKCGVKFQNPDAIFFLVLELTGNVCYSCITLESPMSMDQMKPYLFSAIRAILKDADLNQKKD